MVHDPLSPREALRTRIGAVLAAVSLLALVYGVLIVAELLLGVLVAGSLSVGAYLWYRTFAVLDSVADAAQRIADAKERESGETADRDESGATRSNRLTERER
ncbi:hypothetical protein SAMN04488066_11118 [Halorubrum aquaticum]|uniref:Uncharacterized protein n=1 Tax=Halorubrum aquaticum TaxID=387340 RepID=A0A1I3BBG4_9EURY|nr:hypothetical protein [Halorubrum aquaticum]SFH59416.1 hypothetical protein SAMN04488066_11118 [Halorubrum aquaticum]